MKTKMNILEEHDIPKTSVNYKHYKEMFDNTDRAGFLTKLVLNFKLSNGNFSVVETAKFTFKIVTYRNKEYAVEFRSLSKSKQYRTNMR